MTKLNFIILEHFLALHPELSEEERAAILALDQDFGQQKDVQKITDKSDELSAKIAADFGFHVFDPEEMATFLTENHLGYEKLHGPKNPLIHGWRFDLARYIPQHIDNGLVPKIIPTDGFPILPGTQLLTAHDEVPAGQTRTGYNLQVYLDYVKEAFDTAASPVELMVKLDSGPLQVREFHYADTPEGALDVDLAKDPLFWKLIDPLGDGTEEKLAFIRAFRAANRSVVRNGNTTAPGSSTLFFYDLTRNWKDDFFAAYAHPESIDRDKATDGLDKFKVPHQNKKRFEAFLLSEDFKSTLYQEKTWSPSLLKSFLKFFDLPDTENARIVIAPLGNDTVHLLVGDAIYQVSDIIETNGYHCLLLDESHLIIGRIVQLTTTTEDIGLSSPFSSFKKTHVSNVEPLDKKEAQTLFDAVKKNGLTWELEPYLPFLCTHGLLDIMAEQTPWLKEPLKQLERQSAEEALVLYQLARNTKPRMDRNDFESLFSPMPSLLSDLSQNPNPKACLLFLLYQSSVPGFYGESWHNYLPELFTRLYFDAREIEPLVETGENKIYINDEGIQSIDIVVDPKPSALGNLWIAWNEKSLPILADAISRLSDDSIREALAKAIDPQETALQEIFDRHASAITTTIAESNLSEVAPKRIKNLPHNRINREDFIQKLKLASTRDKVRLLPSQNMSELNLDFILCLELTGPEREDIRRTLPSFLRKYDNPSLGISGDEHAVQLVNEINHGEPQFELLPTFTIKAVLKNGQMYGDASLANSLWAILFSRSSSQALAFFQELLFIYAADPENSTLKDTLFFGLKHVLQNPSVASQNCVERHQLLLKTIGNEMDLRYKTDPDLRPDLKMALGSNLKPVATLNPLQSANQLGKAWEAINFVSEHSGTFDSESIKQALSGFLSEVQIEFLCDLFSTAKIASYHEANILTILSELQSAMSFLRSPSSSDSKEQKILSDSLALLIIFLAPYLDQLGNTVSDKVWVTYTELCDERFKALSYSDSQAIVITILDKHLEQIHPLPQGVAILAAGLGFDWGFAALDKNRLFTENGDGLDLTPSEGLENCLISLHNFGSSDQFQPALAVFLKKLHDHYGDFNWVEVTPENKWWAGTLKSVFEVTAAAYWDAPPPASSESLFYYLSILEKEDMRYHANYFSPLITGLRDRFVTGVLHGADTEANGYWEMLLFPERKIADFLEALKKFDQLRLPKRILSQDTLTSTTEEAREIQNNIQTQYGIFCYMIKLAIKFKQMELITDIPAVVEITANDSQSPWFNYAVILAQAASGNPQALEELWLYENGTKKLVSDINGFNLACQNLLSTGRFVLMNWAPEKFSWSGGAGKLNQDTKLGMLELGTPFADEKMSLYWDNSSDKISADDTLNDRQHATMVFQTLIGNYADLAASSGKVRSYNLNASDNIWSAFDAQLALIVSDVKNGHAPSVLNLSIGIPESVVSMGDAKMTEFFKTSPQIQAIRQKLRFLKQHKIPICVAAGNDGENIFNLLGALDPSLILVGSTRISDRPAKSGYQLSHFSSVGSASVHTDIATLGEGYRFLTRYETAENVAGTSFSSPQISRLIAQMKELSPKISVETIQAILKMTATDMAGPVPTAEGAGYVNPNQALYVAFVVGNQKFPSSKQKREAFTLAKIELAEKLALGDQSKNLDWLAQKIQTQVFWQNTFRQGYGE